MRRDKIPTVIFSEKAKEQEQQYHCKYCFGSRMVRMSTGLRCQLCGSPLVATKTVMTFNNPSLVKSQALEQEK